MIKYCTTLGLLFAPSILVFRMPLMNYGVDVLDWTVWRRQAYFQSPLSLEKNILVVSAGDYGMARRNIYVSSLLWWSRLMWLLKATAAILGRLKRKHMSIRFFFSRFLDHLSIYLLLVGWLLIEHNSNNRGGCCDLDGNAVLIRSILYRTPHSECIHPRIPQNTSIRVPPPR